VRVRTAFAAECAAVRWCGRHKAGSQRSGSLLGYVPKIASGTIGADLGRLRGGISVAWHFLSSESQRKSRYWPREKKHMACSVIRLNRQGPSLLRDHRGWPVNTCQRVAGPNGSIPGEQSPVETGCAVSPDNLSKTGVGIGSVIFDNRRSPRFGSLLNFSSFWFVPAVMRVGCALSFATRSMPLADAWPRPTSERALHVRTRGGRGDPMSVNRTSMIMAS